MEKTLTQLDKQISDLEAELGKPQFMTDYKRIERTLEKLKQERKDNYHDSVDDAMSSHPAALKF